LQDVWNELVCILATSTTYVVYVQLNRKIHVTSISTHQRG